MRQRIELLSMTVVELQDLVTRELIENPVLELEDPDVEAGETAETPATAEATLEPETTTTMEGASEVTTLTAPSNENSAEERESESEVNPDSFEEIDFGATFEEYLDPGYKTREYEPEDGDRPSYENVLTRPMTLADHLMWQLQLSPLKGEERDAAEMIIGNLNEDGYLDATLLEISKMGNWELAVVEGARRAVQLFDPLGVASLTRKECLLVQLAQRGLAQSLASKLVGYYLERLQPFRFPDISKDLGVTVEDIRQAMEIIRTLEPYPGRKYSTKAIQYIEPEVYIEKIDGEYYIYFNDDGMPHLRISSQYRRLLENNQTSKETRDYIKGRFRSAIDLLRNIEHRRHTIYRVCESIVRRQRAFLEKGIEYLKPMMLKEIAEDIEMHLSTVSRVVNGKYAHTPQGVIELRRFFTEGMTNDEGEEVSTRVIKLQIKKMIETEDARNPLTDDEIAQRLATEGMKMSRRTVAKYRDQMQIPGSRERRVL
jgi:RNA polymerase sigma-54 factor